MLLLHVRLEVSLPMEVVLIVKREMNQWLNGWPSGSETGLILAPNNFEPNGIESDNSSENTSNDSDHNRLSDFP